MPLGFPAFKAYFVFVRLDKTVIIDSKPFKKKQIRMCWCQPRLAGWRDAKLPTASPWSALLMSPWLG